MNVCGQLETDLRSPKEGAGYGSKIFSFSVELSFFLKREIPSDSAPSGAHSHELLILTFM